MNPYSATTNVKPERLKGFQWRRAVVFAVLIFAATNLVGFLGGFTMAHWQIYGATMGDAVANSRIVRRVAYGVVGALLYWGMAAPLANRRWLHVLVAFACVQVVDILVSIALFHATASELVDPGSLGRGALAALVGLALASLGSKDSSKPTPLHGAA